MTSELETLRARIAELEEQVDTLQEEVRQYRDRERGATIPLPIEFGLTGSEEIVLRHILSREFAGKEGIHHALTHQSGRETYTAPRVVDVFVCRIRKKLTPHNVEIKTHWGKGYSIDAEIRARFA